MNWLIQIDKNTFFPGLKTKILWLKYFEQIFIHQLLQSLQTQIENQIVGSAYDMDLWLDLNTKFDEDNISEISVLKVSRSQVSQNKSIFIEKPHF